MIDAIQQLDTRQKVILVITTLLFAFVVYYGYQTFFASDMIASEAAPTQEAPPPPPPPAADTPAANVSADNSAPEMGTNPMMPSAPSQGAMNVQPPEQPTPEQLALLQESQAVQQEYLRLVNEYQILQLKQKLEEANAAIATSRLQSTQTMAQIQLLTDKQKEKSMAPVTAISSSSADNKEQAPAQLKLVYVGKQMGVWTAMINADSSYFEVKIGTRLPDGSVVTMIDEKGVALSNGGKSQLLTMPRGFN